MKKIDIDCYNKGHNIFKLIILLIFLFYGCNQQLYLSAIPITIQDVGIAEILVDRNISTSGQLNTIYETYVKYNNKILYFSWDPKEDNHFYKSGEKVKIIITYDITKYTNGTSYTNDIVRRIQSII